MHAHNLRDIRIADEGDIAMFSGRRCRDTRRGCLIYRAPRTLRVNCSAPLCAGPGVSRLNGIKSQLEPKTHCFDLLAEWCD